MKAKTINGILRRKAVDWASSLPKPMRKMALENLIITGGCIPSMLLGEDVNDYDFYFKTKDFVLSLARHYVEQFKIATKITGSSLDVEEYEDYVKIKVKSQGVVGKSSTDNKYRYFEVDPDRSNAVDYVEALFDELKINRKKGKTKRESEYHVMFLSSNAITLSGNVQIIIRFYGNAEEIHKSFDYVHCTNYWTNETGLVLNKEALTSLLSKELRYMGSLYPIASIMRMRKFIERGWTINAGQILKMAWQVSNLNLSNVNILEDQLLGVDVAYFEEIISLLRENSSDSNSKEVDHSYLMKIIDQVF